MNRKKYIQCKKYRLPWKYAFYWSLSFIIIIARGRFIHLEQNNSRFLSSVMSIISSVNIALWFVGWYINHLNRWSVCINTSISTMGFAQIYFKIGMYFFFSSNICLDPSKYNICLYKVILCNRIWINRPNDNECVI